MNYVIRDFSSTTQAIVDDCIQGFLWTLRRSTTGNCILKYSGAQPASLAGLTEYTQSQMLTEVAKPEWEDYDG